MAKFLDIAELSILLFLLWNIRWLRQIEYLLLLFLAYEKHSNFPSACSWLDLERVKHMLRSLSTLNRIVGLELYDLEVS